MIKDREKKPLVIGSNVSAGACHSGLPAAARCPFWCQEWEVGGGGGRGASPVGGEICLFGLPAFCRFLFCFVF